MSDINFAESLTDFGLSPRTVVVTDASTILGIQVVRLFLDAGFRVRGLVREEEALHKVWRDFADDPFANLELKVVPSLVDQEGLSEVLSDATGVIHTAIPAIDFSIPLEEGMITALASETKTLLEAIHQFGGQVSSVVLTTSILGVIDTTHDLGLGKIYNEQDWNPIAWDDVSRSTQQAAALLEKTREQMAWTWLNETQPIFKLSTICAPTIVGPIPKSKSISDLPHPIAQIWAIINGQFEKVPSVDIRNFVDVRDAATAHLQAFLHPQGGRFLCNGGKYCCADICNILHSRFPEYVHRVPNPGEEDRVLETYTVDDGWTKSELNMEFRGLEESIVDTIFSLIAVDMRERHLKLWNEADVGFA